MFFIYTLKLGYIMDKNNLQNLRQSINSKFSKLIEPVKIQDIDEDLESILRDIESKYDFNEDVLRKEFSYVCNTKDISILYLDDEENNLNSFYSCFRHDFNIFLAHTTDVALDILTREKIDIVITDQKMPKMSGLDFLIRVKNKFEKCPMFIMVSAYVDSEVLIDAINNVHIFKFLHKPFDIDEIKNTITEAYSYHLNK